MASERPGDDTPSRDAERDERGGRDAIETESREPDPQSANAPTQSPWWSAPAGRPVAIPAFGRSLLEALLNLLAPEPVLVPVRVRNTRRRV